MKYRQEMLYVPEYVSRNPIQRFSRPRSGTRECARHRPEGSRLLFVYTCRTDRGAWLLDPEGPRGSRCSPRLAPSAIRANSQTLIATGLAQVSEPIALTDSGIQEILDDYRRAASNAREAGFDGVEIHAANGYLIDQFLKTGSNQRTDEYGGVASNRVRFLTQTVERVLEVWDSGRVGVRLSPTGGFNDMHDDNPQETFAVAVEKLNGYGLGYLHIVETAQNSKGSSEADLTMSAHLRTLWKGLYVVNGGYDGPKAEEAVRSGHADAVTFGRLFLANPDLPRRLQLGAAPNEPDPTTFYGGGAVGYTSYPALP